PLGSARSETEGTAQQARRRHPPRDHGPTVPRWVAPTVGAPAARASVVEDERDLEDDLERGHRAVGHLDGLLLDPRARDVAQRLARALDPRADGVVEARRRAGADGGDAGDRTHGCPPVAGGGPE